MDAAHLDLPALYVALAPALGPMDVVACLAHTQIVALVATLGVLFVGWRCLGSGRRVPWRRRATAGLRAAAGVLAAVLVFFAALTLLHRPMAALRVDDPALVVVDFHGHTERSHDGRPGFDREANRAWHAAAGYDVAYLTDHYAWHGREEPRHGEGGVAILDGAEMRLGPGYVVALGELARYDPMLSPKRRKIAPWRHPGPPDPARPPTLVVPLPLPFERIEPTVRSGGGAVVALELHDSDPRGIEQLRREHARLLDLAQRLRLAYVSGANLHGWGRTATAWTLLRIPGWTAMTPGALGAAIEATLRANAPGTIQVVERAVPYPGSSVPALALTLPVAAAHLVRTLQPRERVAWLVWIWGAWLLAGLVRRSRRVPRAAAAGVQPEPDRSPRRAARS